MEFDGVSWRTINIPNMVARSLTIDDNGSIYVGGYSEIGFLARNSKGTLFYKSLLNHLKESHKNFSYVFSTHNTKKGIYFRTLKFLFRWDSKQMKVWESNDRFGRTFVCEEKFFLHQRNIGLMQMKDDSLELIPGGEIAAGKRISMLVPYGENSQKLLIGTRANGFYIYDGKTIKPFPTMVDDYVIEKQLYHGIGLSRSSGDFALATRQGGLVIIDSHGNLKSMFNKSRRLLADNVKYVYKI